MWYTDQQKPVISRDFQFESLDGVSSSIIEEEESHTGKDQGGENQEINCFTESESSDADNGGYASQKINQVDQCAAAQSEFTLSSSKNSSEVVPKFGRPFRLCRPRKPRECQLANNTYITRALSARAVQLSYKTTSDPESVGFRTPSIEKEQQYL